MSEHRPTVAVFPGTFDPITLGHFDIVRRGAALFDELIVGVGENPDKAALLPAELRAKIVREAVAELANVRVQVYAGLTVDFARHVGATVLLRGVRDGSDLRFEVQVAQTNRQVAGVETLFILPAPQYAYISSGLVRQVALAGGDVSAFVPPQVLAHLPRRPQPAE